MRPYGQRLGANDFDGADRPVAVVLKRRARAEGAARSAADLEDYAWLDKPMAGLREESGDGLEDAERITDRVCVCGAHMERRLRRCATCRETARLEAQRKERWKGLSSALRVRTCACGIVFALKYEEPRCSICRAPEREREELRARARRCDCGAMFAAKATQAWCDGCRLKSRKDNKETTP